MSTSAPVPEPRTAPPGDDVPDALEALTIDLSHDWVGAAEVPLADDRLAKNAVYRTFYKTRVQERINVLEVYCKACRRQFESAMGEPCSAKINNDHLIGGTPGKRAPRKVAPPLPPGAVVVTGPRINRRGLAAVLSGEA